MKTRFKKGQKVFWVVPGEEKYIFHYGKVTGVVKTFVTSGIKVTVYDVMEMKFDPKEMTILDYELTTTNDLVMFNCIETIGLFIMKDLDRYLGEWLNAK